MNKYAFIFPGQGAQYVGMCKDFYDQFACAREVFEEAEDVLSIDLAALIFEGPLETLTLTKNSQLAIYVASMAMLRVIEKEFPHMKPSFSAGLSLGEYTALTAAHKLSFSDCLLLVRARGAWMNDACVSFPGSMHVVLGMELDVVEAALQGVSGVWIANLNCPGQIVLSGTTSGLENALEILKVKGMRRALPLDVSGAFHSGLMQEAAERLSPLIDATPFHSSPVSLVMNVSGEIVAEAAAMRSQLKLQVTSSVLWEKCVRTMMGTGVSLYVEIGPGKTLQGMNKRIGVKESTISIETVKDLQLIEELHAQK